MKKVLSIILLSFMCISVTSCNQNKLTTESARNSGKVNDTLDSEIIDNEGSSKEYAKWVLVYEKNQYSDEFDNPSIEYENYYEYDSSGKIISEKYEYDSRIYTVTHFEYDEKQNVVYKTGTVDDCFLGEYPCSFTYTYDNNNNCVREFVDWSSSTDDITYEYDEHGNIVKEHSVYTSKSGISESTYYMSLLYEGDMCVQNEIMVVETTKNGKTNTRYAVKKYTYDDNGNKEKELYYTEIDSINDAKNPVQINGRYYMLYYNIEYTYKKLGE